jgi:hypothetical protein
MGRDVPRTPTAVVAEIREDLLLELVLELAIAQDRRRR